MKRRIFAFILRTVIFLFSLPAIAQTQQHTQTLQWQIITKNITNQKASKILWFAGATYHSYTPTLPVYTINVPLKNNGETSIFLTHYIYKEVTDAAVLAGLPELPQQVVPTIHIINKYTASPAAIASMVPLRRNAQTGAVEMLVEFTLEIDVIPVRQTQRSKKDVTASALASGTWYKLGVTETSIYKLDQKYLRDIGFDVNNIDAKRIKIYGKGGGMLPHANNILRDDDLVENAIKVVDNNNNNRIDGDDYVLFYAKGPTSWRFNSSTKRFEHQVNYYADTSYYFITADGLDGKRITDAEQAVGVPLPVNTYTHYANHHVDQLTEITKYVRSGREWYGEDFRSVTGGMQIEKNFSFNLPNYINGEKISMRSGVLARSKINSRFTFFANGSQVSASDLSYVNIDDYLGQYASALYKTDSFTINGNQLNLNVRYTKSTPEATGWLDFIELNAPSDLKYNGSPLQFRNIAFAPVKQFHISNAPQMLQVWDVTDFHDVKHQKSNISGSQLIFTANGSEIREYVAHDGNNYSTPKNFGKIANQNLHGLDQPDMVIVSHGSLLDAANRLAEIHRLQDGFTVHVITPQQIYNEFSSGGQDVAAIRDLMRMFYTRAITSGGKFPKYLVLFGDASYDYKYRSQHQTNLVPTYQGQNALRPWGSYCSDDFFGFLDDNEGEWGEFDYNDDMELSIGRFPVITLGQAHEMIDKIVRYQDKKALRPWRNTLTFIADDEDSNTHFDQTEDLVKKVENENYIYNIHKIYLDAHKQESSSSQARYPSVERDISATMDGGTLLMNYVGHGGELGLAHEKILEIPDVNAWKNMDAMPLFITATCEVSRFDDPERASAGELMFLNPKGGAIAMFTTTRVVSPYPNRALNEFIVIDNLLKKDAGGKAPRMGDVFRQAKNNMGFDVNTRSFTMIGDPALRIALPENEVVLTHVNDTPITSAMDTFSALGLVKLSGEIRSGGQRMSNFNGTAYITVYDKASQVKTLVNDPDSKPASFKSQENIIFKGNATVTNGIFHLSFIVPKDISFMFGQGKLSLYAENTITDAHGANEDIIVGGVAANPVVDDKGPEITLFINDTVNYRPGSLVDENPVLIAKVSDDIGINTTGNGIGHDLTGVLNNGETIILNNYYQADKDNYKRGEIRYPFFKLPDGEYRLRVKVWDVANNSAEAFTHFIVASSSKLAISKIFNYPNPFNTETKFNFEHNRPNEKLFVHIGIYSIKGQLVKQIKEEIVTEGNRANVISWNGSVDGGGEVSSGIYIYRLTVQTEDGQVAQQSERLVVIK